MSYDIIVSALVFAAAAFGAAVWVTFDRLRETRLVLERTDRLQWAQTSKLFRASSDAIRTLEKRVDALERSSPANLAVEVAGLAADVERLASMQRKQFGRVFAELQHDGTLRRNQVAQQDLAETPEQVRERLRAQHGLPKLPGGNGATREE